MDAFDQAIDSARIYGGKPYDYWRIHYWLDMPTITSQSPLVGFFRHHIEGALAGQPIFTHGLWRGSISDVALEHYEQIVSRHLQSIYGVIPSAEHWLSASAEDHSGESPTLPSSSEIAETSAALFGGQAQDYLPLHQWMMASTTWRNEWDLSIKSLLFRHNTIGVFEAEEYFGPEFLGEGSKIKTKDLARHHIRTVIGNDVIPEPCDIIAELTIQPWMDHSKISNNLPIVSSGLD
jgi:hypothetical protein